MKNLNNPYIELVQTHPNIITDIEKIYIQQGKWNDFFENKNPISLEIGTGMGNFFGKMCEKYPKINHIGLELRFKRLYTTAQKAKLSENKNFVVIKDFGQNIDKIFAKGELSQCIIFFPDPYSNKKRQLKHRMITVEFLQKLAYILEPGGKLFFKTDHDEYFSYVLSAIKSQDFWNIQKLSYDYQDEDFFNIQNITEFEAMYRGKNKNINYLELLKK